MTRINIELTFPKNQIEDLREARVDVDRRLNIPRIEDLREAAGTWLNITALTGKP